MLVAFNVVLRSGDLAIAREIARTLRERGGGLRTLRLLGIPLGDGRVQVSCNITDVAATPLHRVAGPHPRDGRAARRSGRKLRADRSASAMCLARSRRPRIRRPGGRRSVTGLPDRVPLDVIMVVIALAAAILLRLPESTLVSDRHPARPSHAFGARRSRSSRRRCPTNNSCTLGWHPPFAVTTSVAVIALYVLRRINALKHDASRGRGPAAAPAVNSTGYVLPLRARRYPTDRSGDGRTARRVRAARQRRDRERAGQSRRSLPRLARRGLRAREPNCSRRSRPICASTKPIWER